MFSGFTGAAVIAIALLGSVLFDVSAVDAQAPENVQITNTETARALHLIPLTEQQFSRIECDAELWSTMLAVRFDDFFGARSVLYWCDGRRWLAL